MAGFASIGLSFATWTMSLKAEKADTDRADRWGILVGHWAPTFFGLGNALRSSWGHGLRESPPPARPTAVLAGSPWRRQPP